MTRPLFVIRPQPGLSATVAVAQALGLAVHGEPLFSVRPVGWTAPDPAGIDGLLIGSANALRHGGPALERLRDKPAYVVGDTTAQVARDAGFAVAAVGKGGLQGVLDGLAGQRLTLLRVAGAEHVLLTPPPGVTILLRVAYESVALPLPAAFAARLRQGGVVMLHSAAAARHLAAECDRLDIARARLALAALGPRIVAAAGEGWQECRVAAAPRESELLALARDMCH
jgi:uroporphyrinogen-III synthase